MSEENDSIWNHKTCIPVQPLPGLSWEPVVQPAQAPSLRVVPGDQDDNWHGPEPLSTALSVWGAAPTFARFQGALCLLGSFLRGLRALFSGRGPPWVCQSPAALQGPGAPLHRKSVCVESLLWPGFMVEPGSR